VDHNTVTAENVVIATGTKPARPPQVEFDDDHVIDSDAVLKMQRVPGSLVVVGAGVIGIEYASMFAALGTRVTVVERQPQMLGSCDPEVVESLKFHLLAATSMDQGRLAAYHAFGEPARELQELQPIGIYTVPEISYCGKTEAELTNSAVLYEVGISRYRELARGAIVGDSYGMLKLLVSCADRTLLGVHVFGSGATDLVHIGQAIMGCGGTVDYLVDTVLNYPTLSEAYKVAALDVTNKMRTLSAFGNGD